MEETLESVLENARWPDGDTHAFDTLEYVLDDVGRDFKHVRPDVVEEVV